MCAVLSSVCATTADNSGVYVCYLKGIVSVCFRCPARTVGFSETRLVVMLDHPSCQWPVVVGHWQFSITLISQRHHHSTMSLP